MHELEIHSDHPYIKSYLISLEKFKDTSSELKYPSSGFASLLKYFSKPVKWKLFENFPIITKSGVRYVSGACLDGLNLVQGVWINLSDTEDIEYQIKRMLSEGIPTHNTLFQNSERLVLWRRQKKVFDTTLEKPKDYSSVLNIFFKSSFRSSLQLEQITDRLLHEGPIYIASWLELIRNEYLNNEEFKNRYDVLADTLKRNNTIDIKKYSPDILLLQYILLRRLCDKAFKRTAYITSISFSRIFEKVIAVSDALKRSPDIISDLEPVTRQVAVDLTDDEKLIFLETILNKFFPEKNKKAERLHFVKAAKKIYARFLVKSVQYLLEQEFEKSLATEHLKILHPFFRSGQVVAELLGNLDKKSLIKKYNEDIYGHDINLLSLFFSHLQIESEYLRLTGKFSAFSNLDLIDTLSLSGESSLDLYSDEYSDRIEELMNQNLSVIMGETPDGSEEYYKKRKSHYSYIDKRVFITYASASTARNKSVISDIYVKAIRWASDKIAQNKTGIIALVCKNNFIEDLAFDGLRKHLVKEFSSVYILDIFRSEKADGHLSMGENKAILILVKNKGSSKKGIFYQRMGWEAFREAVYRKEQFNFNKDFAWRAISPDKHHTWLTEGLQKDFETHLPMGTKISKSGKENAIFRIYGRGVATARDAWMYNFDRDSLAGNIQELIQVYNKYVQTWTQLPSKPDVDEFISESESGIPWSESLKSYLRRQVKIRYKSVKIRNALYRPFVSKYLYFDQHLIERWYQIPYMLPTTMSEKENRIICVTSPGSKNTSVFITNLIPDLNLFAGASPVQCFPLYHYDREKKTKIENITDWALQKYIDHYKDSSIIKFDIFHYTYAMLHHPDYIRKYAANLRKELPRIPFVKRFNDMVEAGKNLARLHLFWEGQAEYPLRQNISFANKPDWQIEKMQIEKDQRSIKLNDYVTLSHIPSAAFEYIIGQRSVLEWVIDQYRLREAIAGGGADDPNRPTDPTCISRLIAQVITVSLETVKIIKNMPSIDIL